SEIALRIQATCKSLGIKTVAIYAPEDAQASYVYEADESYPLSLRGFQAYLNQEEILSIALQAGVDALHPGYGFLSESASFAEKVIAAGIIWIGPNPETMLLMGDKAQARALMRLINVPINQGAEFKAVAFDLDEAKHCAQLLGYPVIIKDSLGGGGKAMRRVDKASDFDSAWHAVLSEGKRLGFSGNIIVEKYLPNARHIEIQIAGDGKNFIHFFERECSVQRKHQKIIEEAPCRFVDQSILSSMYAAALSIAQAVKYINIGTVEFLVASTGEFYFLEVNARLQVEHSVTELTTGVDLVALQIYIAVNDALPISQQDIIRNGHAIECRIYAEDPLNNFMPSVGTVQYLQVPRGPFVRVDHDLQQGEKVTPFFDAMIAKITVRGMNRSQALANMLGALHDFMLAGCTTNVNFLRSLITSEAFKAGAISTHWLLNANVLAELNVDSSKSLTTQDEVSVVVAAALKAALDEQLSMENIDRNDQRNVTKAWKMGLWK
ncbi:ATP-grasp domain-containing protein, partial [Candidatus Dependentiae bacterium]|nr:ATP-grasp domain-containing protein [Candidatus Dependentiae bacterium]